MPECMRTTKVDWASLKVLRVRRGGSESMPSSQEGRWGEIREKPLSRRVKVLWREGRASRASCVSWAEKSQDEEKEEGRTGQKEKSNLDGGRSSLSGTNAWITLGTASIFSIHSPPTPPHLFPLSHLPSCSGFLAGPALSCPSHNLPTTAATLPNPSPLE